MAYGSTVGLQLNIPRYDAFITAGTFTAAIITEARRRADQVIDTRLSGLIDPSNLPLTTSTPVDHISDDYTTCFLLRGRYTDKQPDASDWVESFCEKATEALDELLNNPEQLQDLLDIEVTNLPDSNTRNQDRIFSMQRTTDDGESVVDTGTMDKW